MEAAITTFIVIDLMLKAKIWKSYWYQIYMMIYNKTNEILSEQKHYWKNCIFVETSNLLIFTEIYVIFWTLKET
jgi:hypothetical protein